MPASESALTKSMIRRIKTRGGMARKTHGGRFSSGLPDIIACYRGYFLGIEVKMPGKESSLTTIQKATLLGIKRAGGIARMYVSVVQVDRLLNAIDRREERRQRDPKQPSSAGRRSKARARA